MIGPRGRTEDKFEGHSQLIPKYAKESPAILEAVKTAGVPYEKAKKAITSGGFDSGGPKSMCGALV